MSVRFMSTHVVNTLSFVYVTFSHRSGIVEKKIVAMTFAPTYIYIQSGSEISAIIVTEIIYVIRNQKVLTTFFLF